MSHNIIIVIKMAILKLLYMYFHGILPACVCEAEHDFFEHSIRPRLPSTSIESWIDLVNRLYAEYANLRPQPWPYSMNSTTLPVFIAYSGRKLVIRV